MLDRCNHNRETNLVHHHPEKIDRGHTIRTKGVRRNGICSILKTSSHNEKYRNQKRLDEDARLKEKSTEDGVDQTKCSCELSVLDEKNKYVFVQRKEYKQIENVHRSNT